MASRRIVIKVGSSTLASAGGGIDRGYVEDLVDQVGELTPAPIFLAVHSAAAALDERLVALDHAGHLIALSRVHEKYDLVVPHADGLLVV